MNRNRLHNFVNHFAADFCAHNINLWPVVVSDFEESHPIAVSYFPAERVGDFIVQAITVSNLWKWKKLN